MTDNNSIKRIKIVKRPRKTNLTLTKLGSQKKRKTNVVQQSLKKLKQLRKKTVKDIKKSAKKFEKARKRTAKKIKKLLGGKNDKRISNTGVMKREKHKIKRAGAKKGGRYSKGLMTSYLAPVPKCRCPRGPGQVASCPCPRGGACGLDYMAKRGGNLCVGERLHDCLARETKKNNSRPLNGKRKKQNGGAKKGKYTAASLKRLKAATPVYAKKYAKLANGTGKVSFGKGDYAAASGGYGASSGMGYAPVGGTTGASGYKKAKNRPARIGRITVQPKKAIPLNKGGAIHKKKKKSMKKKKGGGSGYKKPKNRQARIDSKSVQPRKPVRDDSKFV